MSQQNSKIEFLAKMDQRIALFPDLALFLIGEGVVSNKIIADVMAKAPNNRPAEFYVMLRDCEKVLPLISWEWTVLPQEFMKLTIVTHNGVKEFVWSE